MATLMEFLLIEKCCFIVENPLLVVLYSQPTRGQPPPLPPLTKFIEFGDCGLLYFCIEEVVFHVKTS